MPHSALRALITRAGQLREGWEAMLRVNQQRDLAQLAREEEDIFMMLSFAEMMGIPNPAPAVSLEMLPLMLERMHDWHLRQGLEHSPLEGIKCC
ncbi:cory-CC-star protein [Cobetia crustatorum]|uniref:cory-CC-star protein n=1 Tax=Cobetia crustatorum TaxID=553385 RepID=UPI000A053CCF|nr:cory-CC-star protein [Cobetia crustatorum]